MKNEKFLQSMSGLDEKFVREANRDVNMWLDSMEGEPVIVNNVKKASPWKIMASAVCTAAALFGVFVLAKNVVSLGGPEISASSGGSAEPDNFVSPDELAAKNYFGGAGEIKADDFLLYDENNIYFDLGGVTPLLKYNKNTNTVSVACEVSPTCDHSLYSILCKAKSRIDYCVFNGKLLGIYNGNYWNGIGGEGGYMYLCGEEEKLVYKNELPNGIDRAFHNNYIGYPITLGDDYLVLFNGGYFYILDKDFNIAYTVTEVGSYMGGVYYVNNEIYYIDDQYSLQKLDKESGEPSPVDLGGKKLIEGYVSGDVLWFSTGDALCSYDFKTGEVKEHAENAVRLKNVGKYVEYMIYKVGDVYLYDTETGEIHKRENITVRDENLFFHDGVYYKYNEKKNELTLYEDDLTTVIRSCTLSE